MLVLKTLLPDKPFLAVTCSRDTTMRFWSTEELCPSGKLRAVLGADMSVAATAVGGPEAGAYTPTLTGKAVGAGLKVGCCCNLKPVLKAHVTATKI